MRAKVSGLARLSPDVDLALLRAAINLSQLLGIEIEPGQKAVGQFHTLPGVFAGGDAVRETGAASTVMAVQDGKLAAAAIHSRLMR